MSTVGFHWSIDSITPQLKNAVGSIVLHWALIEFQFIRMCEDFWRDRHSTEKLPRAFDRRADILLVEARNLYSTEYPNEPEEFRLFSWYMQRLKTANGKRDAIVHGMPGKITKNGREYEGLLVPFPSQDAKHIPMSMDDLWKLDVEIWQLYAETCQVSLAVGRALSAASPNRPTELIRGEYVQLMKENRSPKLPRLKPPPPTFEA